MANVREKRREVVIYKSGIYNDNGVVTKTQYSIEWREDGKCVGGAYYEKPEVRGVDIDFINGEIE